jgi:AcrR family transcriptional regulator
MSNIDRATRTRHHILDAAWDLVMEQGASASIADIAAAAGITRQSVYVHFGSRGGLLMALLKRTDDRLGIFENFAAALAAPDPAQRLDRAVGVWLDFVRDIVPVARDIVRLRASDEDAAAAWNDRMRDLVKVWQELARSLDRDGALVDGWVVNDAADYIWVSTSVQAYDLLTRDRRWSHKRAVHVIRQGLSRAVLRDGGA